MSQPVKLKRGESTTFGTNIARVLTTVLIKNLDTQEKALVRYEPEARGFSETIVDVITFGKADNSGYWHKETVSLEPAGSSLGSNFTKREIYYSGTRVVMTNVSLTDAEIEVWTDI